MVRVKAAVDLVGQLPAHSNHRHARMSANLGGGLRSALDPQARAALPTEDAWGHMLGFEVFAGDHAPMECYAVWSAGPDGLPSAEGRGYPYLTDEGLGDDLAWVTCGSSDPISFRCGPPRIALIRAWHWLKGS